MRILTAVVLLVAVAVTLAQNLTEPVPITATLGRSVDAVGTEFTFFFQENAARKNDLFFDVQIFLTTFSEQEVSVEVSMPLDPQNNPTQSVTCKKGEVTEVTFPQAVMHIGSSISNKGIHVLATGPIIVYGVNPQRFSSEGFISIPNHLLGTEYYSIGMPAEDQHSQLGVVAVLDGETTITVTLPNNPELDVKFEGKSYSANDVITATLNQYQTFQLQHSNKKKHVPDGDMSGARIECSQRCAAFSGNSRTSVEGKSRDLLVEQLPPVTTWGKEFAIPPTPERTDRPDVLKLVCQQDGTTVLIDGTQFRCDAGDSIQEKISTTSAHYVQATKPIMAATVVMSQEGSSALIQADPAMTLVIPEEQYAQTYTIATATWSGKEIDQQEYDNYLSVVIRRNRIDSMVIDGQNVNTKYPDVVWKDVPGTETSGEFPLVTTYFKIESGTHTISTLDEDATFMCIVYGAGDRESYAYMGGMRLQVINPACTQVLQATFGDGVDNDCDAHIDEEFCDATDDDNDGAIDEDCAVKNAVIPLGNKTIMVGESTTLKWTVYATDFANFQGLSLYKKQPTANEVLLASGNGALEMESIFSDTGRYSLTVSEAERKGELDVVEVELRVTGATTQDPGDYRLAYTASDGETDGTNRLTVKQNRQEYEIIAKDLETGAIQTAKSGQSQPRNLYFQEGKDYSLTFHSIGGKHLDDLPYRMFLDGNEEVTADFEVTGVLENYVTGQTVGLQDVKEVYQLQDAEWKAETQFNQRVLGAKNSDSNTVVDAVLNVESLVRPSISCRFSMEDDDETGKVICDITDVTVDLDTVFWEFDGNMKVTSGAGASGDYIATHTVDGSDSTKYVAVLDGIKRDQWPANDDTRTFKITFNQTNGYSLSAETPVSLSDLPAEVEPGTVTGSMDLQSEDVKLTAYVTDGKPASDTFSWTLPDGSKLSPGGTSGQYVASDMNVGDDGIKTFHLTLTDGLTTEEQQITFNASAADAWWGSYRYELPAESVAATITPSVEFSGGDSATVYMDVVGGSPAMTEHEWSFPDQNGNTINMVAGDSQGPYTAGQPTDIENGQRFPLTITDLSVLPKDFQFVAKSKNSNGQTLWRSTGTQSVNYRASNGPTAECGLRSDNLKVGDEAEIVCTVQPNGNTIDSTFYENIMGDGTSRNITDSSNSDVFRYSSKTNPDGTIEASLFFDVPEDMSDLSHYNFYTVYGDNYLKNNINLLSLCSDISPPPQPDKEVNDQDVCVVKESGCDYGCVKNNGITRCTCPEGMMLSSNDKTCVDIDECATNPCEDNQKCVNTLGSYHCISDCVCQCCEENEQSGRKKQIISPASRTQRLFGIETGSMTLTCRIQDSGSNSFDDLTWTRKSNSPNRLVQTVVSDGQVQQPFADTGRFIENHRVTPEGLLESELKIINLQRTDAAEYSCQYSDRNVGTFNMDVIGSSFMVNNQLFNGLLTDFTATGSYRLRWEFESISNLTYRISYGGEVFDPSTHVITTREGTRYDSFAQGNVKVYVVTIENRNFSPQQAVIQTLYVDPTTGTDRQIATYVLKTTGGGGSGDRSSQSSFVSLATGRGDSFTKDQTVTTNSTTRTSVTIEVMAPNCNEDIKVLIGSSDQTASFLRATQSSGGQCLITLTRYGYNVAADKGKNIQTVHVTSNGNVVLSTNPIELIGTGGGSSGSKTTPEIPTNPPTPPTSTDRESQEQDSCNAKASSCDYGCEKKNGVTRCTCPTGMVLALNGKTCVDVDECSTNPCGENQKCVNTYGSYLCLSDCVCQCCEDEQSGRKKRSADKEQKEDNSESGSLRSTSTASINDIALLCWLSILTAFTAITFFISIMNRRRVVQVKTNEQL